MDYNCQHFYQLNWPVRLLDKEVDVDWNTFGLSSEIKTLRCPFIDSVKVNKSLLCVEEDS